MGKAGKLLVEHQAHAIKERARGLLSRYVIDNRIDEVEALTGFDREGYAYAAEASGADTLVFRRRQE